MALYGWWTGAGDSGFGWSSTAAEVAGETRVDGTWLLTGCTAGIGRATLDVLRDAGAEVWGTSRSAARATAAGARGVACELTDHASILAAIETLRAGPRLSGIIANAGAFEPGTPAPVAGRDRHLMTNHVGHFLLITRLLDHLTPDARIIVVASDAHRWVRQARALREAWVTPTSGFSAYSLSKLANVLFAKELSRRLGPGQRAVSLHPGSVHTDIARSLPGWAQRGMDLIAPVFLKSPEQGAATTVFAATAQVPNGAWLCDANVAKASTLAEDVELAAWLWEQSEALVSSGW